ncbi:T-cell-specific guanine nucleotide triphosphate-binding protein 2-like [Talpa occidentalis]|uniref:T-cell-specific guanine nucleotide triphosphate-binding protein 2-like n=1 Tax=Talpa occidentalis TaxID=50954 RepID=UPI00188E0849|nr:T-cell-specific guanine nucleotide triphosphate-binding protein 2-like [Talpa occidentalis]
MGQSSTSIKDHELASSFDAFLKNFKSENTILSPKNINLIKSCLKKWNVQKTAASINKILKDIEDAPINIAVTGESGAGKSSFINALWGINPDNENAANTGMVEITMGRTPYQHPRFPQVIIWSLPDIETTKFQPETYLKEMKYEDYDFFLIISASCVKQSDIELCKAIKNMKNNFYFIRTKVDSVLYNLQRSKYRPFNKMEKEKYLQKIKNECLVQLQKTDMTDPQVFLISSFEVSCYDFPKLEATLLSKLPAEKRYIFRQCLPGISEISIDQKRDSLRQKFWLEALRDGALTSIPFMGYISHSDVEKLEETSTYYRSYFGLDDVSLENMAKDLHMSVEQLKTNIVSPSLLSVDNSDEVLEKKLLRYLETFCFFSGGLQATGVYFQKIFYFQNYLLDTMVSDAKILLNREEIFKDSLASGQSYSLQHVGNENEYSEAASS